MGRSPSADNTRNLKKGPWTPEEDEKLVSYINKHGSGKWRSIPKEAGLNRCGKSCRLRWTNYLRADIRRGRFTVEEEDMIIKLHSVLGNKWSRIAADLPGRTDNEIKNHWNTHLRKKLLQMGVDPVTHKPRTDLNLLSNLSQLLSNMDQTMMNPWDLNNALRLQSQTNIADVAKLQVLQSILQILNTTTNSSSSSVFPNMDQTVALNLGLSSNVINNGLGNITNNIICPSTSQGFPHLPNYTYPNQLVVDQFDNTRTSDLYPSFDGDCNKSLSSNNTTSHETLDENLSPEASIQNESTANSENGSFEMNHTTDDFLMEGWEKLLDDANSDFWKEFIN